MIKSNKETIGRETAYVYIQSLVSSISGYIFWVIITQLTSSVVVGNLSAIVSVTEILTSVGIIGIPYSVQRLLGKTFYEKNMEDSKVYVTASFIIISLGVFAVSVFIIIYGTFFNSIESDQTLKLVIILIIASSTSRLLLSSIVISYLKTKVLAVVSIISSTSKIILSIFLALLGTGVIGLSLSYLFFGYLLSSILIGISIIRFFKSARPLTVRSASTISLRNASKNLFSGGVVRWVPMLVTTIGYQLGTIVLFGSKGSEDTAVYFISLTIVNAILLGTTSLTSVALPALSSIQDGRKRMAWQTIRWGYLISIPLAASLIFYSQDVLRLFGQNYADGYMSLQILLLSILPTIVANGLSTLLYSYGNYRQSLAIDLVMNIPRTVLYFTLIPLYGPIGAAVSFTLGSLLAFVISLIIARRIKMLIFWKDLVLVFIIPLVIGYVFYILQVNYVIALPIIIVASYISLLKVGTISKSDIQTTINILPPGISNQMLKFLRALKRK